MAKKFFYEKVHNTKRTIMQISIIGVCLIGVIICFIIINSLRNTEPKDGSELNIKNEVTISINEEFNNDIFFSKIENFNINDVIVTYPDNFSRSIPGEYEVILTINKEEYKTKLVVIDTTKPNLSLRDVVISQGESYNYNDFVYSCNDNSSEECIIDFYKNGIDIEGNMVDYSSYTTPGVYPIKIIARDKSNNEIILETSLTIKNASGMIPEKNNTCKYGNSEYSYSLYTPALIISTGGCAINPSFNKATEEINKIIDQETKRLTKELEKLNLSGTPYLNRRIYEISNLSDKGIIGYELEFKYSLENNEDIEVIAEYKIDIYGRRTFSINKYNLPK